MDYITGVSVTVQIRRLVLRPVSTQFEPLLLLLLHECLQSTRNQSRTNSRARVCVQMCVRAYVRSEKMEMGDESRRRYNTDSTARPERLLNLSNEGSLHLSSGYGDGRADKVRLSPVGRAPVPPREDTVYLFILAYVVSLLQHRQIAHTGLIMHDASTFTPSI